MGVRELIRMSSPGSLRLVVVIGPAAVAGTLPSGGDAEAKSRKRAWHGETGLLLRR